MIITHISVIPTVHLGEVKSLLKYIISNLLPLTGTFINTAMLISP